MHFTTWISSEGCSERQMSLCSASSYSLVFTRCCHVLPTGIHGQLDLRIHCLIFVQGATDPKNFALRKLERKTGYLEFTPGKYEGSNSAVVLFLWMEIYFEILGSGCVMEVSETV